MKGTQKWYVVNWILRAVRIFDLQHFQNILTTYQHVNIDAKNYDLLN